MKLSWKYPLPKQQFRPFDCFGWTSPKPDEEITDKHIKRRSDVDKAFNLGALGLFIGFISLLLILPSLIFEGVEPYTFYGGIAGVFLGCFIYIYAKKTNVIRYNIFDRDNGSVRLYGGWPTKTIFEVGWSECEGELWFNRGRYGRSEFWLWLSKKGTDKGFLLTQDIHDPEGALRYWSFLVQYMDNTKPLPDTVNFKQYDNRTTGLWTEEEFERARMYGDFEDPYQQWLEEQHKSAEIKAVEDLRSKGRFADTGHG
jgi:hypothetical protein